VEIRTTYLLAIFLIEDFFILFRHLDLKTANFLLNFLFEFTRKLRREERSKEKTQNSSQHNAGYKSREEWGC